ncbi:hypothetical protein IQ22_03582 [Pseudomonas duriflava]|uniref:Uncharacterized protein n=2 Tax=Pseudomonas duriflava TaxID=459528 RepID=A0A562Q6S4_9PSED|nr:hypothetical protein IQ22_03582 [Pseudomonas duriflava]
MRIRGRIGDWPVDLTVELDAEEWSRLGSVAIDTVLPAVGTRAQPAAKNDPLWEAALSLVQREGRIEGPRLLEELEGLAGNIGAAKQLIVRLRHNPQIRVEKAEETQLFVWLGAGDAPAPETT